MEIKRIVSSKTFNIIGLLMCIIAIIVLHLVNELKNVHLILFGMASIMFITRIIKS